jgi:hypothetical protein
VTTRLIGVITRLLRVSTRGGGGYGMSTKLVGVSTRLVGVSSRLVGVSTNLFGVSTRQMQH